MGHILQFEKHSIKLYSTSQKHYQSPHKKSVSGQKNNEALRTSENDEKLC